MHIDHIHFYSDDAAQLRQWFVAILGWHPEMSWRDADTQTEVVRQGSLQFWLSSPLSPVSRVAAYLAAHPPGVVDIAFNVPALEAWQQYAIPTEPEQQRGAVHWLTLRGWGSLRHTLIHNPTPQSFAQIRSSQSTVTATTSAHREATSGTELLSAIDHVVLNVAQGDLETASAWYQEQFGFRVQQTFHIQTAHSGLDSQVLQVPGSLFYLNINQPTAANSQIQDFLHVHRGPGIQHIALKTDDILAAVDHLREQGLAFRPVPPGYYPQLRQRLPALVEHLPPLLWENIIRQQILVDGDDDRPNSLLLQIFSHPIFPQRTFFLELIERRAGVSGFGEGNFLALFRAMEHELQVS